MANDLTPQQQRFVAEYVLDLNATQAAIRAGYAKNSAQEQGSRLLSNAMVSDAIEAAEEKHLKRLGVRSFNVLRELTTLGFSDVRHFVIDDDGDVQLADGAPDHAMRAVSSIKKKTKKFVTDEGEHVTHETEIKLWNKNDALGKLAEHLKLLGDNQVNVDMNLRVLVEHRDRPQLPKPIPGVVIESQ